MHTLGTIILALGTLAMLACVWAPTLAGHEACQDNDNINPNPASRKVRPYKNGDSL